MVLGISMSACVPITASYERIEAPDARYLRVVCRGSVGPPSTAYYPFHGIFISLNFSSTEFGLHVPKGLTVQLNDDKIHIKGFSKTAQFGKTVNISAFRQGSSGNGDPPEFRALVVT
jgi:hypothetical protein